MRTPFVRNYLYLDTFYHVLGKNKEHRHQTVFFVFSERIEGGELKVAKQLLAVSARNERVCRNPSLSAKNKEHRLMTVFFVFSERIGGGEPKVARQLLAVSARNERVSVLKNIFSPIYLTSHIKL